MIYFVSGYMRSGTSMMMKALAAGGLEPAYSKERDPRMNERWGDKDTPNGYVPNKQYFELDAADYRDPNFPRCHEGKLVKCLFGGISRIRPCQARLVFMRRPRKDIEVSCLAAFGHVPQIVQASNFDEQMEWIIELCRDRRSFVSIDEVWYDDVLDEPLTVFRQLQWNGWPIDPYEAANVPQRSEKRYAA
jgi:hypothetical protein